MSADTGESAVGILAYLVGRSNRMLAKSLAWPVAELLNFAAPVAEVWFSVK